MIKKIAFIGGRDIHSLGGIENYMFNLSQILAKRGYEVVVYSESDHNGVSFENGVKIVSWKTFHWNLIDKPIFGVLSTLHTIFIERKVDLIHYNAWGPSLASWIPFLLGKKTLMQGHGLEWQRTKYSPVQQKIMKFMEMVTAYLNRNIIMVSQDQTDFFKRSYGRICTTIPPGIPKPVIPSDQATTTFLQKYGLHKDSYFLYLGRLVQDKNPDVLIQAFLKLKTQKVKLVMAGDNPADPGYVKYLKDLCRSNPDIVFTGSVFGEEKYALLNSALAYCIPSVLEGLPISLLEAMSFGKYCIASDIPGCREALGEQGVFVPLQDLCNGFAAEMDDIAHHPEKRDSQGSQNRERALKNFIWDRIADKYVDYISRI